MPVDTIEHIEDYVEKILFISLGAVAGANARYWTSEWFGRLWGTGFPFGTLAINLLGSFLLGLFMTLTAERLPIDPRLKILISVGFLGAYTTFSTYTYESLALLMSGQVTRGLLNLFGSTVFGWLAAVLGVWMGNQI